MDALRSYYTRIARLDLRSVATFRILLGLVVFLNILLCRWSVAAEYYYPENSLFPLDWHAAQFHWLGFSLFNLLGSRWAVQLFMVFSALLALLYTCGVRTRITAPLLWFVWWNLNQRNPLLMAGWDTYIDCLLFCSIFLPLSERFALFRKRKPPVSDYFVSPAALLILVQVAAIYCVNGLTKTGSTWLNGTAVSIIASDALLSTGVKVTPFFSKLLSWLTLVFEAGFPLLLFIPWKQKHLRLAAALVILFFHWGISLVVDVGWFKWASLSVVVLLLPGEVWNRVFRKKKETPVTAPQKTNVLLAAASVAVLFLILLISLRTVVGDHHSPKSGRLWTYLPPKIDNASWLNQQWRLYSPDPPVSDGFLFLTGTTTDGAVAVINSSAAPEQTFNRDPVMRFFAAGMRFRMGDAAFKPVFTPWLTYELKRWNAAHPPQQLATLVMWYQSPGKAEKVAEIAVEY